MRKSLIELHKEAVERERTSTDRASDHAAMVFCKALNQIYAALGVATLADALQEIENLNSRIEQNEMPE